MVHLVYVDLDNWDGVLFLLLFIDGFCVLIDWIID